MNNQEILDNAPEGATHCTDTVPSMNLYAKVEHLGGFYVSLGNRWEQYPIYCGIHLLEDIRAIVERDKRIAELEKENAKLTSLLSDVQDERKQFLIKQGHICLDELSAEINQVLSSKLADLGGDL